MSDLSDDARAVAAAWFGMSQPGQGHLRFAMVQSKPSARAQAGLNELLAAGIISREDEPSGAVTYRPLVSCYEHQVWAMKRLFDGTAEANSFRLVDPIEPRKKLRKRAGTITIAPLPETGSDTGGPS
ncbi:MULTISPECIES: hypothetical protein [Bacteria]|uniref:hypothetical protein n=1 Tax=Bacteria TaxID=2 RepID=UPI0036F690B8